MDALWIRILRETIIVFYKFYDFICRPRVLVNRKCYNNLFQIMQLDNFRNLTSVVFLNENI